MKNIKKLLSITLAVLMLASAFSVVLLTANAVEPDNSTDIYKNLNDVVGSDVETKTLRFYMPDDWMNTYNHFYDGKDLSSCKPAITWYDGSLDCLNYYKDMEIDSYPGYYITDKDETDSNIFVLNIPKDVLSVMFNNTVKYTSDDMRENNDLFKAVRRSVTVPC